MYQGPGSQGPCVRLQGSGTTPKRQNFHIKVFYVLTEIAKLTNILFTKLVSTMHVVVLHLWAKTLKNTGGTHL